MTAWRAWRRQVTRFDAALLSLVAGYFATILFFAPVYVPRYAFPVWMLLGVGTVFLALRRPGWNRVKIG